MGWESRKRGGRYYTRSRRVGDRVVRQYVGAGDIGEIAALQDELKLLQRQEEAAYWKKEQERFEESTAFLEEIVNAATSSSGRT